MDLTTVKPTGDQVSGVLDRVVIALLMYAVGKGYIDQAIAQQLLPIVVPLIAGAWGWWVNRPKAIVVSAAALPNTTVITTQALADATPSHANIVASVADIPK
jgi:hypothetical protein